MNTTQKAPRIHADEVAAVAAEGVSRALAARAERLRELSPEEQAAVAGGGLVLSAAIIAGGRLASMLLNGYGDLGGIAGPASQLGNLAR